MEADRREVSEERWGPYPLILAGAAVALLLIFLVDLRWGGFVLGTMLMLGGAFRFAGYGGPLAVRGKVLDVLTLAGLGFVIVLTALLVDNAALKSIVLTVFGR